MKTLKFFVSFLLIFAFTQCKKAKVGEGMPVAIQIAIEKFDKENSCNSAKVDEYKFQSQKVYVFDPGICGADMTSRVADKNNKTLGYLGGLAGNTKINGEDFSNANYIRTLWKK